MNHDAYSNQYIRDILDSVKTVALVVRQPIASGRPYRILASIELPILRAATYKLVREGTVRCAHLLSERLCAI